MAEVSMKAPDGVGAAGVEGVEYEVDNGGYVDVAVKHVAALVEHGFVQAERPAIKKRRPKGADPALEGGDGAPDGEPDPDGDPQ